MRSSLYTIKMERIEQISVVIQTHLTVNFNSFNVGKGTAWRCVMKVMNALYSHLYTFIKWLDRERSEEIWTYIENKHKFLKVIGAVDGTHIKISAPKLHADSYINRKGYHSIQV